MNKYKKLGKDFLFMLLGNMGSKVIAFLIVPFYTAVLTTEEYGIADLISTTVTLLAPFFTLIICESMMRFALDKNNDQREVWIVGCRFWTIGTGILILCSPIVLLTPLKNFYVFVVLHYISYSLHQNVSYYTRGLNKAKVFAISGIVQSIVMIGLNLILLLWFKMGIEGYLIARIGGSVASTIYMLVAAKIYRYGFEIKTSNQALKKNMLQYSVPMIPNSVSWWIANASDRYILTAFAGVAATGIYSVAYKIPTLLSTISSLFGNAWKLTAVEDFGTEESKRFYSDIYSKLTALMIMMLSFLFTVNKPLSRFLFSKDFYQAWQCVPILLTASVFHAYSDFLGSIYTSAYKTKFLVVSTSIGAAANIVLNLLFIPMWGVLGAAIATLIGYGIIWISRLVHSRSILKLHINVSRDIVAYLLIGGQLVIATMNTPIEYAVSIVILICVVFVMRGEISGIIKLLARKGK